MTDAEREILQTTLRHIRCDIAETLLRLASRILPKHSDERAGLDKLISAYAAAQLPRLHQEDEDARL